MHGLLCSVCASGRSRAPPFPQARRPAIGCVAGAEELAPRSSASSPTGLGHRSGVVLTREEEHVRFEFWKEIDASPAPRRAALSRHDSRARVAALTSSQVPGGAWGLAAPALLAELGTHPPLAATCNPSCLRAAGAQSPRARAHPLL